MREKILLNRDWRFLELTPDVPDITPPAYKSAYYLAAKTERLKWGYGALAHRDYASWNVTGEYTSDSWSIVQLPHDYVISQAPDPKEEGSVGFFKYNCAWYRRHLKFTVSDLNKRVTIYFEGVTGISDVYFNGCFLKHNDGGYVPFEVDLTDLIRPDEDNVLAVRVDPKSYETWWYAGGGIYRNVWLCKTEKVAVDLWGIFACPKKLDEHTWSLRVQTEIRSIAYVDAEIVLKHTLLAPDGSIVNEFTVSGNAAAREVTKLCAETTVCDPVLWDIDDPNRYTLHTSVICGGSEIDAVDTKFGFRTVELSPAEGFFLNGRWIKLKGVCAHMDCGLVGKAVPDNLSKYRVKLIKEMGANAFRGSHYPHNEATMDACDELGILFMAETRRFESSEDGLSQLETLIRRDRNHPCVFVWSTGNEEPYMRMPQGGNIQKAMHALCKKLDPSRPVVCAMNDAGNVSPEMFEACEIIGANYSMKELDAIHEKYPDKPFLSAENVARGSVRGWYYGHNSDVGALQDARDKPAGQFGREETWKFIMARKWNCGAFQWDAFEHRGEAVWPRLCSVSGAIDMFLQKKDAFWQNLSHWSEEPMVHILPHWNHKGLEGTDICVWAYTNLPEVELFLNGTSLGKKAVEPFGHAEWHVAYTPGKIEAYGYRDGKVVAYDVQETTGRPAALKLTLDNGPVYANGMDIAVVTCTALDEAGREVPDAVGMVHFEAIGGTLVGTGSSDFDHVPVPSPDRAMYAGRISVAVQTPQKEGSIRLYARNETLGLTCLEIPVLDTKLAVAAAVKEKAGVRIIQTEQEEN